MKKITQSTALASLMVLACGSQQSLAETGLFYAGADVGRVQVSGDGPADPSMFVAGQDFEASDTSYGVHLGFQFTPWFAAEVGYTDFGKTTDSFKLRSDVIFIVSPNDTQTIAAKGASISGVFSLRPSTSFSLFGVVGVIAMDYRATQSGGFSPITGNLLAKNSFSDQGLLYGVGAKYSISDSVNLRADVRRHDAGDFTLDTTSIGIEYAF